MTTPIKEQIFDIVKNIKSSENEVIFNIVSWPYSRNVVKAVLETREIEFEYKRLDKRFDQFSVKAEDKIEKKIKKIISLVHKEANEYGKGAKANTEASISICDYLSEVEQEIRDHTPSEDDFLDEDETPKKVSVKSKKKRVNSELEAIVKDLMNGDEIQDTLTDELGETETETEVKTSIPGKKRKIFRK